MPTTLSSSQEVTLSVLPGATEDDRLSVVMLHEPGQPSSIILRQESWSKDVGWFEQSRVVLQREQLTALKLMLPSLGGTVASHRQPARDILPFAIGDRVAAS